MSRGDADLRPLRPVLRPIRWVVEPFQAFLETEARGGILLIAATLAALVWANSPWRDGYDRLWHTYAGFHLGGRELTLSLAHWINDGLMAVFFFWVGLEIKRELLTGELASPRKAALPLMAALGGMVVPSLGYAALNAGGPGAPGWGVPMATDIAFAVGILMLLGRRVPLGVRIFLTTLAVADDLGAVLVIALFYTGDLDWGMLLGGLGLLACLLFLARAGARHPAVFAGFGIVVWYCFLQSGIHATVAGVLAAITVPHRVGAEESPLVRWEHVLAPVVALGVMPVFALANAGVMFTGNPSRLLEAVPLGIALGLCIGKPVGILLFSWLAVKSGLASLPERVGWRAICGAAALGGIGFTMSLFIAGLAFGIDTEDGLLEAAKLGILAGSLLSAIAGTLLLVTSRPSGNET